MVVHQPLQQKVYGPGNLCGILRSPALRLTAEHKAPILRQWHSHMLGTSGLPLQWAADPTAVLWPLCQARSHLCISKHDQGHVMISSVQNVPWENPVGSQPTRS